MSSSRIEFLRKKYSKIDKNVFDELTICDVSNGKKYLDWILRLKNKNLIKEEDYNNINHLIYFHEKMLNEFPSELKDANKFNSLLDFSTAINNFLYKQKEETKKESEHIKNGAVLLFEDEDFLIVKPFSLQGSINYGSNTGWCTLQQAKFFEYIEAGSLYIVFFRKSGEKLQLSFAKNEFRNNKRDAIDLLEVFRKFPKIFNAIKKDKEAVKTAQDILGCVLSGDFENPQNWTSVVKCLKQKRGWILEYADKIHPRVVKQALSIDDENFRYLKDKQKFANLLVENSHDGFEILLGKFPEIKITQEIISSALNKNPYNFKLIENPTIEHWKFAVSSKFEFLNDCPYKMMRNL